MNNSNSTDFKRSCEIKLCCKRNPDYFKTVIYCAVHRDHEENKKKLKQKKMSNCGEKPWGWAKPENPGEKGNVKVSCQDTVVIITSLLFKKSNHQPKKQSENNHRVKLECFVLWESKEGRNSSAAAIQCHLTNGVLTFHSPFRSVQWTVSADWGVAASSACDARCIIQTFVLFAS